MVKPPSSRDPAWHTSLPSSSENTRPERRDSGSSVGSTPRWYIGGTPHVRRDPWSVPAHLRGSNRRNKSPRNIKRQTSAAAKPTLRAKYSRRLPAPKAWSLSHSWPKKKLASTPTSTSNPIPNSKPRNPEKPNQCQKPRTSTHLAASCTKNFCAMEASPGPIIDASPAACRAASTASLGPTAAPGCSENPDGRRPPPDSNDAGDGGKGKDGEDDDEPLSPAAPAAAPSMPPCRSSCSRRSALRLSWSSWVSSRATSSRLNILDSAKDCALIREVCRVGVQGCGYFVSCINGFMGCCKPSRGCWNRGHDVREKGLQQEKHQMPVAVIEAALRH